MRRGPVSGCILTIFQERGRYTQRAHSPTSAHASNCRLSCRAQRVKQPAAGIACPENTRFLWSIGSCSLVPRRPSPEQHCCGPSLLQTHFTQQGRERRHRTSFDVPPLPKLPPLLPLCNHHLICSNNIFPAQFPDVNAYVSRTETGRADVSVHHHHRLPPVLHTLQSQEAPHKFGRDKRREKGGLLYTQGNMPVVHMKERDGDRRAGDSRGREWCAPFRQPRHLNAPTQLIQCDETIRCPLGGAAAATHDTQREQ